MCVADFALWTITTALFQQFQNQSAAKATLPFVFLFYFFYDLAYTPMLIAYTLEILPFNIRAKGFAVMVSRPVYHHVPQVLTHTVELRRIADVGFQPTRQPMGP